MAFLLIALLMTHEKAVFVFALLMNCSASESFRRVFTLGILETVCRIT